MKNVVMTLLVLIMISTLYSGIANESINSIVLLLKYISIPAVLLTAFFLHSNKINLRVVFVFCTLIIYVLATNNINNTFLIFILQLYSIFIIAFWVGKYKQYDLYKILKSVYLISLVLLIFGFIFLILDFSLLSFIPASGPVRYAGFYGSPITWGYANATLSIIGIYLYSTSKNKAYLVIILINLLFMLSSGTRGSFLLIMVFIFYYYIFLYKASLQLLL